MNCKYSDAVIKSVAVSSCGKYPEKSFIIFRFIKTLFSVTKPSTPLNYCYKNQCIIIKTIGKK